MFRVFSSAISLLVHFLAPSPDRWRRRYRFTKEVTPRKTSLILLNILAFAMLTSVSVSANPATLPPNIQAIRWDKAVDPVKGQSLANDPGQSNAIADTALMEAAAFEDSHVMQSLSSNPNEQELRGKN